MASHRGAGAIPAGFGLTDAIGGGQRWSSEEISKVITEIPEKSTRSISDAIAIGAAWRPTASLESTSYVHQPSVT